MVVSGIVVDNLIEFEILMDEIIEWEKLVVEFKDFK